MAPPDELQLAVPHQREADAGQQLLQVLRRQRRTGGTGRSPQCPPGRHIPKCWSAVVQGMRLAPRRNLLATACAQGLQMWEGKRHLLACLHGVAGRGVVCHLAAVTRPLHHRIKDLFLGAVLRHDRRGLQLWHGQYAGPATRQRLVPPHS